MILPFAALGVGLFFGGAWLFEKLSKLGVKPSAAKAEATKFIEHDDEREETVFSELPDENRWVPFEFEGNKYIVSPTYLAPVGIGEAVKIAEREGYVLPTPGMVDAIWQQADLKVDPVPMSHDGTLKTMNSPKLINKHQKTVEGQLANKAYTLVAGTHKDVVFIPDAFGKKVGKHGIYGWHKPNGSTIQSPMWGHALEWKDYSQGLRGIKKVG